MARLPFPSSEKKSDGLKAMLARRRRLEPSHRMIGAAMRTIMTAEIQDWRVACHQGVSRQVGFRRGRGMSIRPPCGDSL